MGEDETSWLWNGKLNFIMDNLIAEGKCKGMIVVMCSGYAFRDDEEAVFFPGDFGRELTEDVIPYMEHTFLREKRTDAPRNGGTFPWVGAGNPDRIEIPESVRTSGSILRGQG